jgi:hypothetical protein
VSRGKVVFSAALQSGLLAKSEKYSVEVLEATDEKASVRFFRDGKPVGVSTFTIAEAKRAGLTNKQVWQQYPSDLLFARAMTRGIRRFAPDLLVGNAAYTREEVGEDVHEPLGGIPVPPPTPAKKESPTPEPPAGTVTDEQLAGLRAAVQALRMPGEKWKEILARRGVKEGKDLSREQAAEILQKLNHLVAIRQLEEGMKADDKPAASDDDRLVVNVPVVGKGKGKKEVKTEAVGPESKSGQ